MEPGTARLSSMVLMMSTDVVVSILSLYENWGGVSHLRRQLGLVSSFYVRMYSFSSTESRG